MNIVYGQEKSIGWKEDDEVILESVHRCEHYKNRTMQDPESDVQKVRTQVGTPFQSGGKTIALCIYFDVQDLCSSG